jgi:hypothetical protein
MIADRVAFLIGGDGHSGRPPPRPAELRPPFAGFLFRKTARSDRAKEEMP